MVGTSKNKYVSMMEIMNRAIEKSIERTCINCGEIEELCECGNFENIRERANKK